MRSTRIATIAANAIAASALLAASGMAQQTPQPLSAQPTAQAQPCKPAKPAQNIGAVQPPSSGPLAGASTKACSKFGICLHPKAKPVTVADEKPCPSPAPANTPATNPVTTKELCPPATTRVTGQPYCLKGDGITLVDVVRVPVSPSTPVPTTPTAPAAQK